VAEYRSDFTHSDGILTLNPIGFEGTNETQLLKIMTERRLNLRRVGGSDWGAGVFGMGCTSYDGTFTI
jgi:hypothetical protein